MYHQNRSVPAINTQMHPDFHAEDDTVPPLPSQQFYPNGLADQFGNMHIGQRGPPNGPPLGDPIPRAGTSMSMRSMQSMQSMQSPHRMAPPMGLPSSPDQMRRQQPSGRTSSVHSGGSGSASFYSDGHDPEGDLVSFYSYDESGAYPPNQAGPPGRGYPPPPGSWHGHGQVPYNPAPPQGDFNHLYAAASDVLGMGPPPGGMPPGPPGPPMHAPYQPGPSGSPYPPPGPSQPQYPGPSPSPYPPQNYGHPVPASQSTPYLGPGPYQGGPGGYPSGSQGSLSRGPSNASSLQSVPPMPPPPPRKRSSR